MSHKSKCIGDLDLEIGKRLRHARMRAGVSQEKLGEALGITFQQVQKYERGTNRVSVSRLLNICTALAVPPTYFTDGLMQHGGGDPDLPTITDPNALRAAELISAMPAANARHGALAAVQAIASAFSPALAAE